MMDMTWNACAAMVRLDTANPGYFEWKVTISYGKKKKGSTPILVQRAIYLVRQEKNGEPIDEESVREEISTWIYKNSKALDEAKGSLPRRILHVMRTKGHETMAASGWQNLAKAREIQGEDRLLNLAKVRVPQYISHEIIANAKWQAIKDGPPLVWEKSIYRLDQNRAKRFLALDSKPWRKRSKRMQSSKITWYSPKNPDGLRFEGDEENGKAKKGKR
jgi:hypothetical protein